MHTKEFFIKSSNWGNSTSQTLYRRRFLHQQHTRPRDQPAAPHRGPEMMIVSRNKAQSRPPRLPAGRVLTRDEVAQGAGPWAS